MVEYLEIGIIVNTHGVKGEVKVLPLTEDPSRFSKLSSVILEMKDGTLKILKIISIKQFKQYILLEFDGIDNMDGAEKLKNLKLVVHRKDAIIPKKDSYFIIDLIDCLVYTQEGELLGKLTDVIETGSNDVYVVSNEDGNEILIPALKVVVKQVSIENKRIIVELPKGLRDL